MASIQGLFCGIMSSTLMARGVDYGRFCKDRGYPDFKLDLDSFETSREIAAEAIAELCNGSCDDMDTAVVQAVMDFLIEQCDCSGDFMVIATSIWNRLPMSSADARQIIDRWFSDR